MIHLCVNSVAILYLHRRFECHRRTLPTNTLMCLSRRSCRMSCHSTAGSVAFRSLRIRHSLLTNDSAIVAIIGERCPIYRQLNINRIGLTGDHQLGQLVPALAQPRCLLCALHRCCENTWQVIGRGPCDAGSPCACEWSLSIVQWSDPWAGDRELLLRV